MKRKRILKAGPTIAIGQRPELQLEAIGSFQKKGHQAPEREIRLLSDAQKKG